MCVRERERGRERGRGRGRAYHSSDRETSRWEQVGLLALQPRTVSAVPPVPAGASATQGDRIAVPPGQVVFSNSKLRLKLDEENTAVGRDPRGTPGRSTSSSTCDDCVLGLTEVAWLSVREETASRHASPGWQRKAHTLADVPRALCVSSGAVPHIPWLPVHPPAS